MMKERNWIEWLRMLPLRGGSAGVEVVQAEQEEEHRGNDKNDDDDDDDEKEMNLG